MSKEVAPAPPKISLYFYAREDDARGLRSLLMEIVAALRTARPWVIGPPEFAEDIGDDGQSTVVYVGAILDLFSGRGRHSIATEVDRRQMEDAEAFIAAAWTLSERTTAKLQGFYDGEQIGEIANGVLDPAIGLMVLDPWRVDIEARERQQGVSS